MTEYMTISAVTVGRHTDIVKDSICTHAVKKELLIDQESVDTGLFVRVECDGCGTIDMGRHIRHHSVSEEIDHE